MLAPLCFVFGANTQNVLFAAGGHNHILGVWCKQPKCDCLLQEAKTAAGKGA